MLFYTSVNNPTTTSRCSGGPSGRPVLGPLAQGPVVARPPRQLGITAFRDPGVFRDGPVWRMLVGAGYADGTAGLLCYSSADLRTWVFVGPVAEREASDGEGDHTPIPASVALVGSLQPELGCPGDWAGRVGCASGPPHLTRCRTAGPVGLDFELGDVLVSGRRAHHAPTGAATRRTRAPRHRLPRRARGTRAEQVRNSHARMSDDGHRPSVAPQRIRVCCERDTTRQHRVVSVELGGHFR